MTSLPDLVTPFRGERYRAASDLSALIAPPYDVIGRDDRPRYAGRSPYNIVHLILPEASPGGLTPEPRPGPGAPEAPLDRYAHAAELLAAWRAQGVLARDAEPAVYVLAQDFALPTGERRTRVGMFAAVVPEPYETGRVRPHEKTHAGPKADRLALLRATATSLESIFLIAPDPEGELAAGLGRVTEHRPDATAELDGVAMRLWVVGGAEATRLTAHGARRPLYIADGHHRYETAVAHARENPAADRAVAFVVSARDPGLAVLATHRVIYGAGRDPGQLVHLWRRWFDVGRVAPCADRLERLAELGRRGTACLAAFPGEYDVSLVLKPGVFLAEADLGKSEAVRTLDVARVDALVVQSILRAGTATPTLTYTADPRAAFDAVRKAGAAAAVLLNPPRVEQVFAVADAGDVMPPKSTFFVPKVPSGVVLNPID